MDDYISRQGAIEALRICELGEEMSIIEIMPSADVVEAVRCKDCIHFLTPHGCGHIDGMVTAIDDGFCSYGERRTDGVDS